jgi:sulfur carrier protein
MTQAHIRINGQDEILSVPTLAALLEEKAVDTEQRGIAVALNGAVVPRPAWKETPLRARATRSRSCVRAKVGEGATYVRSACDCRP